MLKKLILLLAAVNVGTYIISVVACSPKKDACASVTCLNSGTCSNGTCTCPTGYTGSDCSTCIIACTPACSVHGTCNCGTCGCEKGYEGTTCSSSWTDKFAKNWAETDSLRSTGAHTPYTTTIVGIDPFHFQINNIYNCGVNAICRMTTATTFKVDSTNTSTDYIWWANATRPTLTGTCTKDKTGKVVKISCAIYHRYYTQSGPDTVFVTFQ